MLSKGRAMEKSTVPSRLNAKHVTQDYSFKHVSCVVHSIIS